MVELVVFYLHVMAFTAVFTKRWQEEGIKEGALGAVFMSLIFFVGWSMASFLVKLLMPAAGLAKWFDNDAAALTLLTCAEGVFYYFYFREDAHDDESAAPGNVTAG
jgi:uncharacterized membrane protein YhdT